MTNQPNMTPQTDAPNPQTNAPGAANDKPAVAPAQQQQQAPSPAQTLKPEQHK